MLVSAETLAIILMVDRAHSFAEVVNSRFAADITAMSIAKAASAANAVLSFGNAGGGARS